MYARRFAFAWLILLVLTAGNLGAQKKKKSTSDDEGYVPQVVPDSKQKKQKDETQTLPPARELPNTVIAETDRLTFDVSPRSGKGRRSQQPREAFKSLLRTSRGTIVKLRAFVAGSGDLRRVGEI